VTETTILERIRTHNELREILAGSFRFDVRSNDPAAFDFVVDRARAVHPIAQDGDGGTFVTCELRPRQLELLYVSPAGQAGGIARDLEEGLQLIVALPSWREIVMSSGGDVEEMHRLAQKAQRAIEEREAHVLGHQARVVALLGLKKLRDPVALLHRRVLEGERFLVRSKAGVVCPSLFEAPEASGGEVGA
jgi:hypothetical protein